MLELKDITGLGQALTRLIEVVSKGVGAVSSPYLIRKTADARAYEIKTIAKALKAASVRQGLPATYKKGAVELWRKPEDSAFQTTPESLDQRAGRRVDFQERKKQENIENVTAAAAQELLIETAIPDEKPDEDWINRFFSTVQDVNTEQMQQLWGRILAGEIKKPGSYSLRTLDFVRNLAKYEAEVFEHVGRLALSFNDVAWGVAIHDKKWLREKRQISPSLHFLLGEVNLMYPTDLRYRFFMDESQEEQFLIADEHILVVKRGNIQSEIPLPIWKFTGVGNELLALIPKPLDEEYLTSVGRFFVAHHGEVTLGKIKERRADGSIEYDIIKSIEAEQVSPTPSETTMQ